VETFEATAEDIYRLGEGMGNRIMDYGNCSCSAL